MSLQLEKNVQLPDDNVQLPEDEVQLPDDKNDVVPNDEDEDYSWVYQYDEFLSKDETTALQLSSSQLPSLINPSVPSN